MIFLNREKKLQVSIYYVLVVISSLFFSSSCFSIEEERSSAIQLVGVDASESKKIQPESKEYINLSFAKTVRKVAPAVVNIYASRLIKSRAETPFFEDPIFKHFFGDAFPQDKKSSRLLNSLGSGVIVNPEGVVITNLHVIKDAEEIKVVLADGREFSAEVVIRDERTDLAALKLSKDKNVILPFLELRDADELEVGDIVIAVGNPFGIGQTVTMGIVSGLARNQLGVDDFRSFIQTDAAINPGNSGGPLVTLDGRLVGINTSIFSNTGGSIGIGFAIPSNLLIPIISGVNRDGNIIRLWIGVAMQNIDSKFAKKHNLDSTSGVYVKSIFPDSPARRAGLEVGDVILEINNKIVKNESALRFRIASLDVDAKVVLKINRNGTMLEKEIILASPPDFPNNKPVRLTGRQPLSGAVVVGLSPAISSELGLISDDGGVVILSVVPGSTASFAGFLPGDIILKINDQSVSTIDDVTRKLSRARAVWEIDVKSGDKMRKLVVENRRAF